MSPSSAADESITNWLMAGLSLGGVAALVWFVPMQWVFNPDDPNFTPLFPLTLFVGVTGLVSLVRAIRATRRERRFGESVLRLESGEAADGSVRMGASLSGSIRTPRLLRPIGDVQLALQCVDAHRFRRSGVGHSYGEEFVIWEQRLTVAPGRMTADGAIPFSFRLPQRVDAGDEEPPPAPGSPVFSFAIAWGLPFGRRRLSRRGVAAQSRKWRIAARAPLPGTDYEEYFIVNVR